jgi:hypothetical protein
VAFPVGIVRDGAGACANARESEKSGYVPEVSGPKNSTNCPSGTHNLTSAVSCWPLGPAASGFNAIVLDNSLLTGGFADKPDSVIDTRASGTGAGNVYITDTVFFFGSTIHLTACTNDLTACSATEIISGSDFNTQFSDVKTTATGKITVTYGNHNETVSPNGQLFFSVDIKCVVCTPNGAPTAPTCNAPVLVTTEYQPIDLLADLTEVRNSTYPTHVRITGAIRTYSGSGAIRFPTCRLTSARDRPALKRTS